VLVFAGRSSYDGVLCALAIDGSCNQRSSLAVRHTRLDSCDLTIGHLLFYYVNPKGLKGLDGIISSAGRRQEIMTGNI
jgi:hypothetical protein